MRAVLGLLQYTHLSQGIKTLPCTSQKIVNKIFGDREVINLLSYVDITNIDTDIEEVHLNSLLCKNLLE